MPAAAHGAGHAGPPAPNPVPLALYVHLPWCVRKCPYCDFNSHELRDVLPVDEYVDALLADLLRAVGDGALDGRRFSTVFLGGGTPSLFPPAAIGRLLDTAAARDWLAPDAEVTLEANPGTVDAGRFAGFAAAGVNRLSVGVQSFDPVLLRTLGRIHDGDAARRAVDAALAAVPRVSLDLMYALPGQDVARALADMDAALTSGVGHVSAYQLTLEPNTVFFSRPPSLPDEALAGEIEDAVHAALAAGGFARYEISNWALPGQACRHNLNYWRFGDYLGIGAGAHSKLSDGGAIRREARTRIPASYLARAPAGEHVAARRRLGPADLPLEFMMNALRLVEGFDLALFAAHTGLDPEVLRPTLEAARARGAILLRGDHVRPTARGLAHLNRLLAEFVDARD